MPQSSLEETPRFIEDDELFETSLRSRADREELLQLDLTPADGYRREAVAEPLPATLARRAAWPHWVKMALAGVALGVVASVVMGYSSAWLPLFTREEQVPVLVAAPASDAPHPTVTPKDETSAAHSGTASAPLDPNVGALPGSMAHETSIHAARRDSASEAVPSEQAVAALSTPSDARGDRFAAARENAARTSSAREQAQARARALARNPETRSSAATVAPEAQASSTSESSNLTTAPAASDRVPAAAASPAIAPDRDPNATASSSAAIGSATAAGTSTGAAIAADRGQNATAALNAANGATTATDRVATAATSSASTGPAASDRGLKALQGPAAAATGPAITPDRGSDATPALASSNAPTGPAFTPPSKAASDAPARGPANAPASDALSTLDQVLAPASSAPPTAAASPAPQAAPEPESNAPRPVLSIKPLDPATSERLGGPPAQPTREQVRDVMSTMHSQLAQCVQDKHGTTYANVTIQGNGRVSYSLIEGAFAGTEAGSCMARALRSATFPEFVGPPFKVRYPLVF